MAKKEETIDRIITYLMKPGMEVGEGVIHSWTGYYELTLFARNMAPLQVSKDGIEKTKTRLGDKISKVAMRNLEKIAAYVVPEVHNKHNNYPVQ